MKERKVLCIGGGIANWCSHYGKQYGDSSKIKKMELPYDPVIPLLSIYLKKSKTLIQKHICTHMSITALFTIPKIWKQPKCPSIDVWIKKRWYTHNGILLSNKKGENLTIWDSMDEPRRYYAK